MTTTFLAIDPRGVTHKRTSENRTYTHCVAIRPSYEAALEFANSADWAKTERRNYAYHAACATGAHEHARSSEGDAQWKIDSAARTRAGAEKFIAEFPTADAYVAAQHAARVASVEAAKARGYYEEFGIAGWCGRLDLAQKLASKERVARNAEVVILEATVKAK